MLLVMGDFNSRMKFHHSHSGLWSVGYYGINEVNQAREDWQSFVK